MSITDKLPTVGTLVKTAIALVIIFAVTDLIGGKNWILSPISSWRNRGAQG